MLSTFFFSFFLSFPFRSLLEHKTSTAQNKTKKKAALAFFYGVLSFIYACTCFVLGGKIKNLYSYLTLSKGFQKGRERERERESK